jgi:hypothetical protein
MNQKGYASIAVAILISILGLVLYNSVQNSTRTFLAETFRYRARLDAESAIDVFAGELYKAFILGHPVAEGLNGLRYRSSGIINHNGLSLFSPAPNRICFQRSIGGSSVDPICIQLPNDLLVKNLNSETGIEMAFNEDRKIELPLSDLATALVAQAAQALMIPEAVAQVRDPWDPGLAAFAGINIPVTRNFDPAFRNTYSEKNCTDASHQCLKIQFCVRLRGDCRADATTNEFIKQTYVFEKPPTTQLRN